MNREELFDKHLRGELNSAESAELKRLLARDADAGRAFVEHANETALLVRVGSQMQSTDNVVPLPSLEGCGERISCGSLEQKSRFHRFHLPRPVKWAAIAACVAAVALVAISLNRKPSLPPRIVDVYVTGPGVQVTRGGALVRGEVIELQAGDLITTATNKIAVIAYGHESTRIEIQPGTAVLFGDASRGKRFELQNGIIRARVAPQPASQQMAVKTAIARATVLGTEFVMRADESATKLDVIEGKVRLACRTSGKKVTVKAGFSATVNPEAPVNLAPLCSSNCILRECLQSPKNKIRNEE